MTFCVHYHRRYAAVGKWLSSEYLFLIRVLFLNYCPLIFSDSDHRPSVGFHFRLRRNVREDLESTRDIHEQQTVEAGKRYPACQLADIVWQK